MFVRTILFLIIFVAFSCRTERGVDHHMQAWKIHQQHSNKKWMPEMLLVKGKKLDSISKNSSSPVKLIEFGAFWMSKYEITNRQFCYFLNEDSIVSNELILSQLIDLENPACRISRNKKGKFAATDTYEEYPVVMVSWQGARSYCQWLTNKWNNYRLEKGWWKMPYYRLPTEVEWVYAALETDLYSLHSAIWVDTGSNQSHVTEIGSVKKNKANSLGIHGMNDNAHEWCADYYFNSPMYADYGFSSLYYPEESEGRVLRKNAFFYDSLTVPPCGREGRPEDEVYKDAGFRIVQTALFPSSDYDF